MIKLILIRHSATNWDKQQRYLGKTDIGLSQKGRQQSRFISDYLRNKNISAIYSSNLIRAEQTASIIAKYHPLKVKKDEGLNEINFGSWEGMTFNQIQKRFPKLAQKYLSAPLNTKIPGGESLLKFRSRVIKALKKILAQENGTVVIIAHAGVNRIILCNVLKLPPSYFWQIKQDTGAINIIEIHPPPLYMDFKNKFYNHNLNTKVVNKLETRIKWWGVISLINQTLWEN